MVDAYADERGNHPLKLLVIGTYKDANGKEFSPKDVTPKEIPTGETETFYPDGYTV